MKELTRIENALFRMGGVMMLGGAVAYAFSPQWSLWLLAVGLGLYSLMQLRAEYLGTNFHVKRLRRQQLFSLVVLWGAVLCMSMQVMHWGPLHRNEWMVCLAIGSILQLYTAWRLPAELSKPNKP